MKLFLELTDEKNKSVPIVIDETPHGFWLQVSKLGKNPDDDEDASLAVKLEYYDGKIQILVWDKNTMGGDPYKKLAFTL